MQTGMHCSTIIASTASPIHAHLNLDIRTPPMFSPFIPQIATPPFFLPPAVAALFAAATMPAPLPPPPTPPAALKLLNDLAAVALLPMVVHTRQ